MKKINPYLNFNGNAEEAFKFYKSAFGGEFLSVQRFKDMPPEAKMNFAKDEGNKIMHIALPIGENTLMGSDVPKEMWKKMKLDEARPSSIFISTDSREETDKIFGKLAKGGKVNMPLGDTFWGDYFGGLTDKFGISWMMSFTKNPPTQNQTRNQPQARSQAQTGRMRDEMEMPTINMKSAMSEMEEEGEGIKISRVFDAPISKIWELWTNPREVKKWWGPKGFTAPVVRIDFRVRGNFVYCMRGSIAEGEPEKDYCNIGEFMKIVPMKKIVTNVSFADEKGKNPVNASYYEMPGEWPMNITYTITFEEFANKTRLTLEGKGIPKAMIKSARMGWEQSFDKIEGTLNAVL